MIERPAERGDFSMRIASSDGAPIEAAQLIDNLAAPA
jgi:hypothetical protein